MFSEEFVKFMEEGNTAERIENASSMEELNSMFAEAGVDIQAELSGNNEELDDSDLEVVAGGASAGQLWRAYCKLMTDFGRLQSAYASDTGVLIRSYYDLKRYGNMYRTYSAARVDKAIRRFTP